MKSKRLRTMTVCIGVNFLLFGFGIYKGVDLQALGIGLAALNGPLYMYLWGETSRPSGTMKKSMTKNKDDESSYESSIR